MSIEMEKEKLDIPQTQTSESRSCSGAFPLLLPEGYSLWSVESFFTQKSPMLLIGTQAGICGGAPIILGTRLAVHQLMEQFDALHGDKESLLKSYPHITPQQLGAALEYYADHFDEIRTLIEEEKAAEQLERSAI